jgi:hypothetical protein
MVLAHFWLQFEWTGFDFGSLPGHLAWALLALNFSWTVLLLAVSVLVIHAALVGPTSPFARRFVFAVGLFWAIHGAYVWLVPMPLPPRLSWLTFVLAAFPATLVALHWIPLVACRPSPTHARSAQYVLWSMRPMHRPEVADALKPRWSFRRGRREPNGHSD